MLRTEQRESLKEEIRRVEGKVSASSNIELQKAMNERIIEIEIQFWELSNRLNENTGRMRKLINDLELSVEELQENQSPTLTQN